MFRIDSNMFRMRIDSNICIELTEICSELTGIFSELTGICSELARFCSWTTAYTSPPVIWEPKIYKVLKKLHIKGWKKIPNLIKKFL